MQVSRPAGLTLIAVWYFVQGLLTALGAVLLLIGMLGLADFLGIGSSALTLIAVLVLLIAVAYIAIGWGLWELRSWSRLAALGLAGLGLALRLIGGGLIISGGRLLGSGGLLWAIIDGLIIWYLIKPEIQALFAGAGGHVVGWNVQVEEVRFQAGSLGRDTGVPPSWSAPTPSPAPVQPTERMQGTPVSQSAARSVDQTRPLHEPEPVVGWLVARGGTRPGEQLKLRASNNTVGRDGRRAQLVTDDSSVSAEHARIRFENGIFVIYDLASTNGTYVNGRRVEKQRLMDNDAVRLGRAEFVFKVVDSRHRQ